MVWIGFFAALIVVVAINLGLFGALRRKRGDRGARRRPPRGLQLRVAGGLASFAIALFVLGIVFTSNATSTPRTTAAGLTSLKGEPLHGPLLIKATGQQWIWRYNYPNGAFSYYKLVIPVDTEIEMKLESTDVVHTWSVPDLAPKVDAVPGKDTTVVFRADSEGEFWGQSATLSGQAYAPMRTAVEVVSPERFEAFIVEQQKNIRQGQEAAEAVETGRVAEMEAGGEGETGQEGPAEENEEPVGESEGEHEA